MINWIVIRKEVDFICVDVVLILPLITFVIPYLFTFYINKKSKKPYKTKE